MKLKYIPCALFFLVPCDDIMSDRDVKSVEKIEVISLK